MGLEILFPPSLGTGKAGARADLVAGALTRALCAPVRVSVARDYGELLDRTLDADVDLAWAPPSICAQVERRAYGILRIVRSEGITYRSALLCRRTDPLDIEDLSGRRAAWVDPLSTGGYVLPRAHLRSHGIEPSSVFSRERVYGSYHDAAMAVAMGDADVCAVFTASKAPEAVRTALEGILGERAPLLMPFAFTAESPSDGLVITRRPAEKEAAALLSLLRSDQPGPTPRVMLDLCDAKAFVPAYHGDYAFVRSGLTPSGAFPSSFPPR